MENSKTHLLTVLWEVLTSCQMLVRTHGFGFFLLSQVPLENSSRFCNSRFLEVLWKWSPLLTAMLGCAVTTRGTEAPRQINFQNGFESFSESSVYSLQRNLPSRAAQPSVCRGALQWQDQHVKVIKWPWSEEPTRHGRSASSQQHPKNEPVITPWTSISAGPVLPGAAASEEPSVCCRTGLQQAQPPVPPLQHSVPLGTGRDLKPDWALSCSSTKSRYGKYSNPFWLKAHHCVFSQHWECISIWGIQCSCKGNYLPVAFLHLEGAQTCTCVC